MRIMSAVLATLAALTAAPLPADPGNAATPAPPAPGAAISRIETVVAPCDGTPRLAPTVRLVTSEGTRIEPQARSGRIENSECRDLGIGDACYATPNEVCTWEILWGEFFCF